jgi:hypothetical protein
MEKNTVFWAIGIIVLAGVLFNLGDFTANVAKSGTPIVKEPFLRVLTPLVQAGGNLLITADNIKSNHVLKVHSPDGSYMGVDFAAFDRGSCEFSSAGHYTCEHSLNIPNSLLPNGRYYLQTKSDGSGESVGNQAFFAVEGSSYQTTGR